MPPKKNLTKDEKLLTELELELMQILWKLQGGTVHEVIESLKSEKELAYTTVSTMLRILEQKGFVKSEAQGRGHRYLPLLKKTEYESTSLGHLVKRVFDGAPSSLVRRLINDGSLTKNDLEELRQLLKVNEKART